jgi:hypothetical protein
LFSPSPRLIPLPQNSIVDRNNTGASFRLRACAEVEPYRALAQLYSGYF